MINQHLRARRLPVALTALAAAAGTILAGGAAYAGPAPDPVPALRTATKAGPAPDSVPALRTATKAEPAPTLAAAPKGGPDGQLGAGMKSAQAGLGKVRVNAPASALATDELNFGDLDGDGKADLAAIDSTGRLFVYPGKGVVYGGTGPRPASYFDARFQAGTGWSKFTALVRHGDFNNDGKQDIVARDPQGRLWLYMGTGTRPTVVKNGLQVGTGWNVFLSVVGVGDADNDGFDDLMGRRADGTLTIYFGTGNIAAPFRKQTVTGGSSWVGDLLTATGDWTADGNTEFMFRRYDQQIWLYRGSSSGFPANHPTLVFAAEDGPYVQNLVGMGNLTSDATIDGVPVTQPTPDVIVQGVDGFLYLLGVDVGDDFDAVIGRGWSTYRTF
jgi:hypothetical protein